MKKIAYVGIDYRSKTLTRAVLIENEKDFYKTIRLKNDDKIVKKYMNKLSDKYDIKTCYEASKPDCTYDPILYNLNSENLALKASFSVS